MSLGDADFLIFGFMCSFRQTPGQNFARLYPSAMKSSTSTCSREARTAKSSLWELDLESAPSYHHTYFSMFPSFCLASRKRPATVPRGRPLISAIWSTV